MTKTDTTRTHSDAPAATSYGVDREYFTGFLRKCDFLLNRVFRMRVEGLENIELSRPAILAGNHNWGLWGITEVLGLKYAWYLKQGQSPPDLIGQGGPELQKIPLLRTLVRRAGVVVASMEGMRTPLRNGQWVLIQPGAVVDQGRTIWARQRSRMKKVSWLGQKRLLSEQLAYVAVAAEGGHPIYPVAWSGTHELAPILFESTRLLHWTGLQRLRREESLPSFPITLNHVINLGVFLLTPLRSSPWAWAIFLVINVYFDPAFCYPIFPFQLRIKIGQPIAVPNTADAKLTAAQKLQLYRDIHDRVTREVNAMLVELDRDRPWLRALAWGSSSVTRAYRNARASLKRASAYESPGSMI